MTIREKRKTWNEAVRSVCKEIMKYDGIITSKAEREYIANSIQEKWLYKRLTNNCKSKKNTMHT